MRFSILTTAVTAFALCGNAVQAALTPAQMVDNIRMITDKSQRLQAPAQQITVINGPLIIVGQGPFPQIIAGLTDIVSTATTAIAQMQGSQPVTTAADINAIFDAFREFVRVHQALLNILIGKAGLFQTVPFIGGPVAAVLRSIESVVDTIAFSLIDMVQGRTADFQSQAQSLDGSLNNCINAYEGLKLQKVKRTLNPSNSFRALRV